MLTSTVAFVIVNPQILSHLEKLVHCELILTHVSSNDNITYICHSDAITCIVTQIAL